MVTKQRVAAEMLGGEKECIVCTEFRDATGFPRASVTKTCTHAPRTCLECVARCIASDLDSKLWNDISCPECRERLEYDDVQLFADEATMER